MNAYEIEGLFTIHLSEMDEKLKEMIRLDFNHDSIHAYRESIRLFRALLYFYKPAMRAGDYRYLDIQSKKYFDKTSRIRELDVFIDGYGSSMNRQTLKILEDLKQPLMARLKLDVRRMIPFRFSRLSVKLPYLNPDSMKSFELDRQCELFEEFMYVAPELEDLQEKYIHSKRMLSKKIRYIHQIILSNDASLVLLNKRLESFQAIAKNLHDTCVNLRLVGTYKLEDSNLIEVLVENHTRYTKISTEAYAILIDEMQLILKK